MPFRTGVEGGRGHARFAEPTAQFECFGVPGVGCGGVAVGLVAPPQPSQRDPFEDRGAQVDEPVHRDRVVPPGLIPCPVDVGEEGGEFGIAEIREVVSTLRPNRIGHGILAAQDPKLMEQLREAEIVLEICPTSNLLTKALESEDAVRDTFRAFTEHEVPFTIATDGPEMMRTHLRDEFELLLKIGALDEDRLSDANRRGHEATFIAAA